MITRKDNKIRVFFKTNDTFLHKIVCHYMIKLVGSTSFSMMKKTKKYKWNVEVTPKGKTQHVKAKILMEKDKLDLDVDVTLNGKTADIEGYKVLNGKKTPVSMKKVNLKKYNAML